MRFVQVFAELYQRLHAVMRLLGAGFQQIKKHILFTQQSLERKHSRALRTELGEKVDEKMSRIRHATAAIASQSGARLRLLQILAARCTAWRGSVQRTKKTLKCAISTGVS